MKYKQPLKLSCLVSCANYNLFTMQSRERRCKHIRCMPCCT